MNEKVAKLTSKWVEIVFIKHHIIPIFRPLSTAVAVFLGSSWMQKCSK